MIRNVVLPQLGMGMSSGTIVEWMIAEGGRAVRDQPLVSVETEKVVTEIPSLHDGILHIVAAIGTTLPVDGLIAQFADTEEEYRSLGGSAGSAHPMQAPTSAAAEPPAGVATSSASGRIRVSGLARKIARASGIDLTRVSGSGPGGRIVKRDLSPLLAAADIPLAPPVQFAPRTIVPQIAAAPRSATGIREQARIPVTGMRRTIAERMAKSSGLAPHTYLFFEIDVGKLIAARKTMLAREQEIGTRISMTAIYTRALALACRQVPICNAALIDDEIIVWDEVNVGVAVSLPGRGPYDSGLVVPVVRNADTKGLIQIDRDIRDLVARARARTLSAADMADATVTLSSAERLNAGGWTVGTTLLNLPQVVSFSPGAAVRKPVVAPDGQIVAGDLMPCSVSFDHRALDGEPASRLAKKLTDLLSHPELMLL